MVASPAPLTRLLQAWHCGDRGAFGELLAEVHAELIRMAGSRLRSGDGQQTLSRGDLLNEALIKLMADPPAWKDRAHFFATVSLAMRSVLVDHARERLAAKRGGGLDRVTFTLSLAGEESMVADLLTLDRLLQQLQADAPRSAEVLQLTYFAGLERDDIAQVLGVSVATVDRELRFARAWLSERLGRELGA